MGRKSGGIEYDADPYIREWKNEFVKHRYFVTNFEVNVAAMLGLLTHLQQQRQWVDQCEEIYH